MAVERIRRRRPVRQRIIEVGRKKVVKVRSRGLFVLPNLFTTASLFCAFISIVQAMEQNFGLAALMIMLSMLFDGMDGRVARLTHTQSEFGVQFDSIADMTAFGVAPALVMYKFCLYTLGGLGWAAAFVYCLCAGVRLARFNCNVGVVDKRFFQGLPSPAAAALLRASSARPCDALFRQAAGACGLGGRRGGFYIRPRSLAIIANVPGRWRALTPAAL